MRALPLTQPYLTGREQVYLRQLAEAGETSSDGRFTKACAQLLERRLGAAKVLMTPSCTSALEMAAMLCGLNPGDEVIMPSFTFTSTANAVALRGARPVFVDVRLDTLNLDEAHLEAAVTPRTKAIFAVHYAGTSCEMDTVMSVARRHGLLVVEDAAQALGACYRGRQLGSIGDFGAFSFHSTKNYSCGEGGALAVNVPKFAAAAEILREKGTNRSQFLRGDVAKYEWVDVGGSHLPSELSMAWLLAQLEAIDDILARRLEVRRWYEAELRPLLDDGRIALNAIPAHCETNGHIVSILLPDVATRDELHRRLQAKKVGAAFHYVPLHNSPVGRRLNYAPGDLPLSNEAHARQLRLPIYPQLSRDDVESIVGEIHDFFRERSSRVRPPYFLLPAFDTRSNLSWRRD